MSDDKSLVNKNDNEIFEVRHNNLTIDLTSNQLEELERMSRLGLSKKMIAAILGISQNTLSNILKRDLEANLRYERGIARSTIEVAQTAYELAVIERDKSMVQFWLQCKGGWQKTDVQIHKTATLEDILTGSYEDEEVNE